MRLVVSRWSSTVSVVLREPRAVLLRWREVPLLHCVLDLIKRPVHCSSGIPVFAETAARDEVSAARILHLGLSGGKKDFFMLSSMARIQRLFVL